MTIPDTSHLIAAAVNAWEQDQRLMVTGYLIGFRYSDSTVPFHIVRAENARVQIRNAIVSIQKEAEYTEHTILCDILKFMSGELTGEETRIIYEGVPIHWREDAREGRHP